MTELVYFVTIFDNVSKHRQEGLYPLTTKRTVGVYRSFEDAEKALLLNETDMHETTGQYATIESSEFGTLVFTNITIQWYVWNEYPKSYEKCHPLYKNILGTWQ